MAVGVFYNGVQHLSHPSSHSVNLQKDVRMLVALQKALEEDPEWRKLGLDIKLRKVASHLTTRSVAAHFARALSTELGIGPGTVINDRYELIEKLGKGAFGTVYLGKDKFLAKTVVIKYFVPEIMQDEAIRERVEREIKIMGILNAPNIVRVLDRIPSPPAHTKFLVLDVAPGKTLYAWMDEQWMPGPGQGGPLTYWEKILVAIEILKALEVMHTHHPAYVHRDIAPGNIMLDFKRTTDKTGKMQVSIQVTILDLGLAKVVGSLGPDEFPYDSKGVSWKTKDAATVGTPYYYSPEQIQTISEDLTTATDIYSLGMVLYEMMTGEVAVNLELKDTEVWMFDRRHILAEYKSPRELNPEIDNDLDWFIRKCIALRFPNQPKYYRVDERQMDRTGKELLERYPNATQAREVLEDYYSKHYAEPVSMVQDPTRIEMPAVEPKVSGGVRGSIRRIWNSVFRNDKLHGVLPLGFLSVTGEPILDALVMLAAAGMMTVPQAKQLVGKEGRAADSLISLLTQNDFEEAQLKQVRVDFLLLMGNEDLRIAQKVFGLFSQGIGRRILISGGIGRLTDPLRKRAAEMGISGTENACEAEILRSALIRMAEAADNLPGQREIIAKLQDDETVLLEGKSRYTLENFEKSRELLMQKGIFQEGKALSILYIQKPLQQLRTRGMFQKVFADEIKMNMVKGISYTTGFIKEDVSPELLISDLVGEMFRLIVNIQKGDVILKSDSGDGIKSIAGRYWEDAATLFNSLEAAGQRSLAVTLIRNIARALGLPNEKILSGLPAEAENFTRLILKFDEPVRAERESIWWVTKELRGVHKVGGLGDVSRELCLELAKLGEKIGIITPRYDFTPPEDLRGEGLGFPVQVGSNKVETLLREWQLEGRVPVSLMEASGHLKEPYPANPEVDLADAILFSRGVLESFQARNISPAILHINDWQTALVAVYLKTIYKDDPLFKNTKCILSIHNLGYQGNFGKGYFGWLGIKITEREFLNNFEFYGKFSLIKAGIVYADKVLTVSPSYAEEIKTPNFGFGMQGVLEQKGVTGIINGIDMRACSPETAEGIVPYSIRDWQEKKFMNRSRLLERLHFLNCVSAEPDEGLWLDKNSPLVQMTARTDWQKGIDIALAAMDLVLSETKACFVIHSTEAQGEYVEHIKRLLVNLKAKYPDRFRFQLDKKLYDDSLAPLFYAASDIALYPSRYAPCEIDHKKGSRFGAIPVGRRVGGFKDSVNEFDPETSKGNGILFASRPLDNSNAYFDESVLGLHDAIMRAIRIWQNPQTRELIVENAMSADFSWDSSVLEYQKLYRSESVLGIGFAFLGIPEFGILLLGGMLFIVVSQGFIVGLNESLINVFNKSDSLLGLAPFAFADPIFIFASLAMGMMQSRNVLVAGFEVEIPQGYYIIPEATELTRNDNFEEQFGYLRREIKQAANRGLVPLLASMRHHPSLPMQKALEDVTGERPLALVFDTHVDTYMDQRGGRIPPFDRAHFWRRGLEGGTEAERISPDDLILAGTEIHSSFISLLKTNLPYDVIIELITGVSEDSLVSLSSLIADAKYIRFVQAHGSRISPTSMAELLYLLKRNVRLCGPVIPFGFAPAERPLFISYDTDVNHTAAQLEENGKRLSGHRISGVHISENPDNNFQPQKLTEFLAGLIQPVSGKGKSSALTAVALPIFVSDPASMLLALTLLPLAAGMAFTDNEARELELMRYLISLPEERTWRMEKLIYALVVPNDQLAVSILANAEAKLSDFNVQLHDDFLLQYLRFARQARANLGIKHHIAKRVEAFIEANVEIDNKILVDLHLKTLMVMRMHTLPEYTVRSNAPLILNAGELTLAVEKQAGEVKPLTIRQLVDPAAVSECLPVAFVSFQSPENVKLPLKVRAIRLFPNQGVILPEFLAVGGDVFMDFSSLVAERIAPCHFVLWHHDNRVRVIPVASRSLIVNRLPVGDNKSTLVAAPLIFTDPLFGLVALALSSVEGLAVGMWKDKVFVLDNQKHKMTGLRVVKGGDIKDEAVINAMQRSLREWLNHPDHLRYDSEVRFASSRVTDGNVYYVLSEDNAVEAFGLLSCAQEDELRLLEIAPWNKRTLWEKRRFVGIGHQLFTLLMHTMTKGGRRAAVFMIDSYLKEILREAGVSLKEIYEENDAKKLMLTQEAKIAELSAQYGNDETFACGFGVYHANGKVDERAREAAEAKIAQGTSYEYNTLPAELRERLGAEFYNAVKPALDHEYIRIVAMPSDIHTTSPPVPFLWWKNSERFIVSLAKDRLIYIPYGLLYLRNKAILNNTVLFEEENIERGKENIVLCQSHALQVLEYALGIQMSWVDLEQNNRFFFSATPHLPFAIGESLKLTLDYIGKRSVQFLKAVIFLKDVSLKPACEEVLQKIYGEYRPAIAFLIQPPSDGSDLAVEAWGIMPKSAMSVSYYDSTTIVSRVGVKEAYIALEAGIENDSAYAEGMDIYRRLKDILARFKFPLDYSLINRFWIYISDIVGEDVATGSERYKEFNRAREEEFEPIGADNQRHKTMFMSRFLPEHMKDGRVRYQASTGIGTAHDKGVKLVMEAHAIDASAKRKGVHCWSVTNKRQIDPAIYERQKFGASSPKFSRGLVEIVDNEAVFYISGTASIVNQETVHLNDAKMQAEETINNIKMLISDENLDYEKLPKLGFTLKDLKQIRIYIKRQQDVARVTGVCERRLPGIPKIYVVADVCRSDLLVEMEGIACKKLDKEWDSKVSALGVTALDPLSMLAIAALAMVSAIHPDRPKSQFYFETIAKHMVDLIELSSRRMHAKQTDRVEMLLGASDDLDALVAKIKETIGLIEEPGYPLYLVGNREYRRELKALLLRAMELISQNCWMLPAGAWMKRCSL
ncbi:MAG: glycogen/starch synthase [Candidatus Omnitrophica bacterium]|nr:glycogen/starch synthase [Candidatus Omnitrophota bacterium]